MSLDKINAAIAAEGGKPYYVGGCVRDELMDLSPSDYDVEVFQMEPERLKSILSRFGGINEVGKSFGVLILTLEDGTKTEFTIPRRENKEGRGHKGFLVRLDPSMTVAETATRRDFTINAIYKDAVGENRRLHDPLKGVADLNVGRLHPAGPKFGEDPLRVLRGMQFAGRFRMWPSVDCQAACLSVLDEYASLPKERVWAEWYKWSTLSARPSMGIAFLGLCGWLDHYPQIKAMFNVPQNPVWHPEGDVYTHVMHVCDAAATIADREGVTGEDRAVLMFAALCHDMGKPSTTCLKDFGRPDEWRSPGHDQEGVPIARQFLESIGCLERIIVRVLPLIREHMFPVWTPINRRMVRRLRLRLEPATLDELLLIMEADHSGRPPLPKGLPSGASKLIELNEELPPKIEPVVTGRHIMELGVTDGKTIGAIKREVFEAQLEEAFDASNQAEALAYASKLIAEKYSHAIIL
jgi:tRNA nucleotidyltransferase (CCA-adding enzyme)